MHFLRDTILVETGFKDKGLKKGGTYKEKHNDPAAEVP